MWYGRDCVWGKDYVCGKGCERDVVVEKVSEVEGTIGKGLVVETDEGLGVLVWLDAGRVSLRLYEGFYCFNVFHDIVKDHLLNIQ